MKITKRKTMVCLKNILAILLMGIICGIIGAVFCRCISFVTDLRNANPLIFFLLPLAGFLIVFIYKKLRVIGVGTTTVIKSVNEDTPLPSRVALAIFGTTLISHLFGASCGKEGAALQLGGSTAVLISRIFKLDDRDKKMLTSCGMSALFSAVFGTPFGAAIFGVEITEFKKNNLKERISRLIPSLISSLVSWGVSYKLGTHAEHFTIREIPALNISSALKCLVLALASAIVAYVFYKSLHLSEHIASKLFKSPYLRIFIGGLIIVLLTIVSGTFSFNGGGIEVIDSIFEGNDAPFMGFIYKMIFTVVSVAAGFKGGEIVPTLYVGASLGSVLSKAVALDSTFSAGVCLIGLFAGMTKCPIASFVVALEMFGVNGAVFFLIAVLVTNFLSGKGSLYKAK